LRNFASATAAIAGLESVNMLPKQLSKYSKLTRTTENHHAYRNTYIKGPGLPCPTPHVRELEHTTRPDVVLAQVLRFRSYIASRRERQYYRIIGVSDEIEAKRHSFKANKICLVCRVGDSEYDGLRLKCILILFDTKKSIS